MEKIVEAKPEDLYNDFIRTWYDFVGDGDASLITENDKLLSYLMTGGFFTAPASTKYHGAYAGGLYAHSKTVFMQLNELTKNNNLTWTRPESPFIIGMFHDLCKCDEYINSTDLGRANIDDSGRILRLYQPKFERNEHTLLKGHGAKSVMILSQFMTLTEEEMLCIRYHMGAYITDEWNEFDLAIRKYPTTLFVHTADMLASKVYNT